LAYAADSQGCGDRFDLVPWGVWLPPSEAYRRFWAVATLAEMTSGVDKQPGEWRAKARRFFDGRGKDTPWTLEARAASAVRETLNELRREGYFVMHEIEQTREGSVDHVVCGPTGVYVIETKARRYLEKDLHAATRQATQLAQELGVWVTPVICVHEGADARPDRNKRVWIVPHESLLEWVQSQSNQTLPLDAFARFAGRL
jgi:hypothetical protein